MSNKENDKVVNPASTRCARLQHLKRSPTNQSMDYTCMLSAAVANM